MRPGEIYLANFPFGAGGGGKLRPVLLLTGPIGSVPEFLVAYISSVIPPQLLPSDLVLDPANPEHATNWQRFTNVVSFAFSGRSRRQLRSVFPRSFARF
jgi:mRNA interferase MazF